MDLAEPDCPWCSEYVSIVAQGLAEPCPTRSPTTTTPVATPRRTCSRDRLAIAARSLCSKGYLGSFDPFGTPPAKANPRLRPLHLVVRETEFCGLRLAGYFRRRMRENSRNSVRRPRCASLTRRNYGGFCLPGNRPGLSGLHGGGCRNRTDGHRSLASLQNEAACRGFSARNDLSQRMSKSLAGKPKALTMNCYLPVSLRFHSLSSRSRAMVVTCSRALRRLQE